MEHLNLPGLSSTEKRFWAKVDKRDPQDCWPWRAHTDRYGYGTFRPGGTAPSMPASRFSWLLANPTVTIDSTLFVCHRCDNPPCVNPAHLFLGTARDNVHDRKNKKRFTTRPYAPRQRRAEAMVALARIPPVPRRVNLGTFAPKPRNVAVKPECEVAECERTTEGRSSMCRLHKTRMEKFGSTDAPPMGKRQVPRSPEKVRKRIQDSIQLSKDGCWVWQRGRSTSSGYAILSWSGIAPGHRVSYTVHVGPIPEGLHVLHRCDNPPCVNPAHLFLGTNADNIADKISKGRGRCGYDTNYDLMRANNRKAARSRAKLSLEDADYIRKSTERGIDLAARFGVAQQTICNIRKGRRWPTDSKPA